MITVPGKVRDVMGADENLAIDDEQIITLIGLAEKEVRKDLFVFKYNKTPGGNPSTLALWDGSNTSFDLGEAIMDYDFDQSITDDVTGYWMDSDNAPQTASITVTNARYGRITITQTGGSAIPSSALNVYVDYYTCDEDVPFSVMEELGTLFTAHLVRNRFTEPKKLSIINLPGNQNVILESPDPFIKDYNYLLRRYQTATIKSTED